MYVYIKHIYPLQVMRIYTFVFCLNPLEPARAKLTLKPEFGDGFWRFKGSQHWNKNGINNGVETIMVLGGGKSEKLLDMVVQGSAKYQRLY
jgi:hypothetical protein